jgi:phage/plasmid primase-like uncharacterized protein
MRYQGRFMPYITFTQQIVEHLTFLRDHGLDVESLEITGDFVRCHRIDEDDISKRGEYAYKTQKNPMNIPGLVGLVTWGRGPGGSQLKHSTYGQDGQIESHALERSLLKKAHPEKVSSEDVGSKARYLWNQAKETGRSDYLERKGVGAYGIRFLENEYGRVAVIPARDGGRTIQTLQFLNPDGSKRFLKGSAYDGLFHMLRELKDGQDIGLAESYVTAASCLELSGIPAVCAFSSGNLPAVAKEIRSRYPESRLIVFADNDRHLKKNVGILAAEKALALAGSNSLLAFPDFGNIPPDKDASDWNDLIRLRGSECANIQMMNLI